MTAESFECTIVCKYRLGTNVGHFQALVNVLRFCQTVPGKIHL